MDMTSQKARARIQAKQVRAKVYEPAAGVELIRHFPVERYKGAIVAGFWPLAGEIDVRLLMFALADMGHKLALPCTPRVGNPLIMRSWTPGDTLVKGSFGTREPFPEHPVVIPDLVLMPLLAFTDSGERLGYGGGFYDRTIAALREQGEVLTCGVAFAGQKAATLPTDQFDQRLDAIVTEAYFKDF